MLPKTILVPTDLGDGAEEALDYACELAAQLGATVTVLHVVGVPALGVPELGIAMASSVVDGLMADNQAALERMVAARQGRAQLARPLLRTGDARDCILETAREIGADLIVVATHGRRGITRALLGSVAEEIVRAAPCPVLAIREHTTRAADQHAA